MGKAFKGGELSREKLLSVFRRIFKEEPLATVGRTIEKYEMSLLRSFFSEYRTIDIPETKISISLEWFTSDKTSPTFYFFCKGGRRRAPDFFGSRAKGGEIPSVLQYDDCQRRKKTR